MPRVIPYLLACALAAGVPLLGDASTSAVVLAPFPGFPGTWEGRRLETLPLERKERLFLEGFPGHVGRFADGRQELVIRWVDRPTRKLHPASDCFRATGHAIDEGTLVNGPMGTWSSHVASKGGARRRFREQIRDEKGRTWSDASSWYWDATLGNTVGPWWAVTVADPEE